MASIRHPHIVTFFGACFQVSPPIMLLEFCYGGNLEQALVKAGVSEREFSLVQCFNYSQQIASAMTFLHEFPVPIIHRDLHPKNILLVSRDIVKITDFGLAKFGSKSATSSTISAKENGNYRFMAPELYEGKPYDQSVDVYSYSMIIYWIYSGLPPFSSEQNGLEALKKACNGKRPNLNLVKDYRIQDLCELGWTADPSKRPSFDFISEQLEDMTVFTPNIRPIGHQKKAGESNPQKAKRPTNNSTQASGPKSTTTSKRGFASWFS